MKQLWRKLTDVSQAQSPYALFWRIVLLVTAAAASLHVLAFIFHIQSSGLMLDFSTYYTAGKVLNAGLSPYVNHVLNDPALWDGVALNEYSRYLYPPLTGNLFQLLARLPYRDARLIWQLVTLLALSGSMILAARMIQKRWQLNQWLLAITFSGYFFPLLTHLERGQVDAITLFLLMSGLFTMQRFEADKRGYVAGFMFAAATWFKPYSVLLLPFLALQKKWKALIGYSASAAGLLLLSVVLNGLPQVSSYYLEQLPRMNVRSEGENILTHADLITLTGMPDRNFTYAHGRHWRVTGLDFNHNASLSRVFYRLGQRLGVETARSTSTAVLSALAFLTMLTLQRRHFKNGLTKPVHDLIYWQCVLIAILLAAPMTWTMNTVWLLPGCWVLLTYLQEPPLDRSMVRYLAVITLGMLVAATPFEHGFVPFISKSFLSELKYVLAEIVLFIAWLKLLKADLAQHKHPEEVPHVR